MNAEASDKGKERPVDIAIFEHIADYIIQTMIKEDVNAFSEATLLHELLVQRLPGLVPELMHRIVRDASERLKKGKEINLMKEIGGITTQKRMHFRSTDQYNSFIVLFFSVVERYPELLEPVESEDMFERLMIHCIHEFRQKLEDFAVEVANQRCELDYKHKLYIHRRGAEVPEVPTYADFIVDRIDSILE